MENASKALLIAGGVLIALIIIGALVNTFSTVGEFEMSKLTQEEQEQLIAFNEQYTRYANQYVYGTEVITVINKTKNNLQKNDFKYPVTIKINFIGDEGYSYRGYIYNEEQGRYVEARVNIARGATVTIDEEGNANVANFIDTLDQASDIKAMAFHCTNIEYDNSTGRVNGITFVEKEWGDLY